MAKHTKKEAPKKFRPERPIYLSLDNTNFKSSDELEVGIEKLRDEGWLCTKLPEKSKPRPFHMSFNDDNTYQEFKSDASALGINLKSAVIKDDDFEELVAAETEGQVIQGAEDKDTYEGTDAKVHSNA